MMMSALHHHLGAAIRLAAILILLGLGAVPVECAAVYGPHSIFISAEAVSQVRNHGDHSHEHGAAPATTGMSAMANPEDQIAAHPLSSSSMGTGNTSATTSLPTPAGAAVDAMIAVAIFETSRSLGAVEHAPASSFMPLPAGKLLPPPEPPPPQLRS